MTPDSYPVGEQTADVGPEEIQVISIKGNRLYLPLEVRDAFDIRNGDRVLIYRQAGNMLIKIIRRNRTRKRS